MYQRNVLALVVGLVFYHLSFEDSYAQPAVGSRTPASMRTAISTPSQVPTTVACKCPLPSYGQFGDFRQNCEATYEICKFEDKMTVENGGSEDWSSLCSGTFDNLVDLSIATQYDRIRALDKATPDIVPSEPIDLSNPKNRFFCKLQSKTESCNSKDVDPCNNLPVPPSADACKNTEFAQKNFTACSDSLEGDEWNQVFAEINFISDDLKKIIEIELAKIHNDYKNPTPTPAPIPIHTYEAYQRRPLLQERTPSEPDPPIYGMSSVIQMEYWKKLANTSEVVKKCTRLKALRVIADQLCKNGGQGSEKVMCKTGSQGVSLSPYTVLADDCLGRMGAPGQCSLYTCKIEYSCINNPDVPVKRIMRSCEGIKTGEVPQQFD